jgi:hypothetical protein
MGEVIAHFPQTNRTCELKEDNGRYIERWKGYLHDLGTSAIPKRLAGPSFGSRVRHEDGSQKKSYGVKGGNTKPRNNGK